MLIQQRLFLSAMEKINPFSKVPQAIYKEILENLIAKDLATASQVSKDWNKVAIDESMWKKDSVRGN